MTTTWLAAGALLAALIPGAAARAQEGLATSSTISGHNTIQQAPSGGRAGGSPDAAQPNTAPQGLSNTQERAIEQRNSAATQICKGC